MKDMVICDLCGAEIFEGSRCSCRGRKHRGSIDVRAGSRFAASSWVDALREEVERRLEVLENEVPTSKHRDTAKSGAIKAVTLIFEALRACSERASTDQAQPHLTAPKDS